MTRKTLTAHLERLNACADAQEWVAKTKGTPAKIWGKNHQADWMLWLAAKASVDRKLVVIAACAVARTALKHVKPGETRPQKAIETAEAWCRGEATIEQVRSAANAAYAAYAAAYAADAADAADAAAYAANAAAANAAADAAADAAYAADTANAAAYAAYAADTANAAAYAAYARGKSVKSNCTIVRSHLAWSVVEAALEAQTKARAA
jgi:hypothetical protein